MASPNFKNRTFYHCDNLPVLRGMNSKSVHLIATDPPFNKSKDFHATPDSLARGAKFQDRWSWRRDIRGPAQRPIRMLTRRFSRRFLQRENPPIAQHAIFVVISLLIVECQQSGEGINLRVGFERAHILRVFRLRPRNHHRAIVHARIAETPFAHIFLDTLCQVGRSLARYASGVECVKQRAASGVVDVHQS